MAPVRGQKAVELGPGSPIPDKLYFKIGEVSKLVGVQAHVLRYWQSEIPAIRPSKSASNQRRYRYRDVEIFREIRRLLYEERYTLAGARRRVLSREPHGAEEAAAGETAGEEPRPAERTPAGPASHPVVNARAASVPPAPRPPAASGRAVPVEAHPAAPAGPEGALVSLPRVGPPPRPPAPAPASGSDDELVQRLRRGLKDLIRLAGEEP